MFASYLQDWSFAFCWMLTQNTPRFSNSYRNLCLKCRETTYLLPESQLSTEQFSSSSHRFQILPQECWRSTPGLANRPGFLFVRRMFPWGLVGVKIRNRLVAASLYWKEHCHVVSRWSSRLTTVLSKSIPFRATVSLSWQFKLIAYIARILRRNQV